MIGVAILAIVMLFAIPSAQRIIIQNRIVADLNETSAVIQYARAYAIDNQIDTVVCPSADFSECGNDWNNPIIVFNDDDGNNTRGVNEELLASTSNRSITNILSGPAANIVFQGNGAVSSPATLQICHQNREDEYARALTISLQGRVRVSRDDDNDGVHEDGAGTSLDCG